jgi:hypothetical protein
VSGNVGIFSRLDLCYKTKHAFTRITERSSASTTPLAIETATGVGAESCVCESHEGCLLNLSQLLDRVARTPLQGGL